MADVVMVTAARSLGAVMLDDNKTHRNRMNIRSETSSRLYVVAQRESTGAWECSCMGWIRHRTCKHLSVMRPLLQAASNGT